MRRNASKLGKHSLTSVAASAASNWQTFNAIKIVKTGGTRPLSAVSTMTQKGLK